MPQHGPTGDAGSGQRGRKAGKVGRERGGVMTRILVTGATGPLGRHTISRLLARNHQVRILTHHAIPSSQPDVEMVSGDLVTGDGLGAALDGIEVVIHLASNSQQALATDVGGTRNLLAAATSARATRPAPPHIVYISIVGVDRSNMPYYVAKHAAEALIAASGIPWSILRATQFHGFIASILRSLGIDTQPEITVPADVRAQSVDVGEVAERLVTLAELGPLGHIAEIGGPQTLDLETMARTYLRVRDPARAAQVRTGPLQSLMYDAWRTGCNLAPDHAFGVMTWEEYLTQSLAPRG